MWMKKKLLPTDRIHEKFVPKEKIGLNEMKRIKLSSSKRVLEMAVEITKKQIYDRLRAIENSAHVVGAVDIAADVKALADDVQKDL